MALKPTIKSLGYSLKMYWSTESEIESALADLARRIFNQLTWQESGLDITEYATVREYCRVWRLEDGKLGFLL